MNTIDESAILRPPEDPTALPVLTGIDERLTAVSTSERGR